MNALLLTRFEDVPAGRGRPGPLGRALLEGLTARGLAVSVADPLDGMPPVLPGIPVLTALHPSRFDVDLPCLRRLSRTGVKILNHAQALSPFSDPVLPLEILEDAGFPVYPYEHSRRAVPDGLTFPVMAEVHKIRAPRETLILHDRGSLEGLLDFLWRRDAAVLLRQGLRFQDLTRTPIVSGRAV